MKSASSRRFTVPLCLTFIVFALLPACSQTEAALESEDDKTLYSLGLALSRNLTQVDLTETELETVLRGVRDGVLDREPEVALEEYGPKIADFVQTRVDAKTVLVKAEGIAYLAKMAEAEGAQKTESGVVIFDEVIGEGPNPTETGQVKLHYRGTFPDGEEFDSSMGGEPITHPTNGFVPCFTEAILDMKVGGKRKFICPSDLAYGERGSAPLIPPSATLAFEVELIEVIPNSGE